LELNDWMNQSPENEREFVRLSTLLHATSRFADEAENTEGTTPVAEVDESWLRRHVMPLAAGLVTVAAAVSVALHIARTHVVVRASHHTTALSEAFTLEDKSYIRLYGESQIRIAMSENARLVKLAGNGAAFDIEANTVPFQVKTAGLLITATGTQFNVIRRNQEDRTDIYLKDGKLDVSGRRVRPLQMASGDVVKVHDGGTVEMTRAEAVPTALASDRRW
jgi:ferric-dicitrate binding protein FerR (iron transport regulator)